MRCNPSQLMQYLSCLLPPFNRHINDLQKPVIDTYQRDKSPTLQHLLSPNMRQQLAGVSVDACFANQAEKNKILQQAVSVVGSITELDGQSNDLLNAYLALYNANFHGGEAESNQSIRQRLRNMQLLKSQSFKTKNPVAWRNLHQNFGDTSFHALAILDKQQRVIAINQFSVLPLCNTDHMVIYCQYICTASSEQMAHMYHIKQDMRRKSLLHLMHTMSIAIGQKDAIDAKYKGGIVAIFFESDITAQSNYPADKNFVALRLAIHNKAGAKIMLLEMPDKSLVTPLYQPSLTPYGTPIPFYLCIRPLHYNTDDLNQSETWQTSTQKNLAQQILTSYYDCLKTEGYHSDDINHAKSMMLHCLNHATNIRLLAPTQLPPTETLIRHAAMLQKIYYTQRAA